MLTVVLALLAAVLAVADWLAAWNDRRTVRYLTKPATMVALIGVAVTLDPADPTIRAIFVVGLVLSMVGDVFLLTQRWFVAGLSAFLLAHLAYIAGFVAALTSWWGIAAGAALVLVAILTVGRRIVAAVRRGDDVRLTDPAVAAVRRGDDVRLTGPVVAYLMVISVMVVTAFGSGSPAAIAGAGLFYLSDAVLAWDRFVRPLPRAQVGVMVTYHLAQAGLVAFLI